MHSEIPGIKKIAIIMILIASAISAILGKILLSFILVTVVIIFFIFHYSSHHRGDGDISWDSNGNNDKDCEPRSDHNISNGGDCGGGSDN